MEDRWLVLGCEDLIYTSKENVFFSKSIVGRTCC